MSEHPLDKTAADEAYALAKLGASFLPGGGDVFAMVFSEPLAKRRDEFLRELERGLSALNERFETISIEGLCNDTRFLSALISATRSATATHRETKRAALRNGVLNVACRLTKDENVEEMFLHHLDRLTPSLIELMAIISTSEFQANIFDQMQKPTAEHDRALIREFDPSTGSAFVESNAQRDAQDCYNVTLANIALELYGNCSLGRSAVSELGDLGLIKSKWDYGNQYISENEGVPDDGRLDLLTDHGRQFIRFISEPT